MTSKIVCQTKSNHNKGELGCVPGLPLKHHHKTSKLVQKYSTQHAFYPRWPNDPTYIKAIKQDNKQRHSTQKNGYS